ncbi:MAG: Mov34/MPN/PAD-1 family protein [Kofleriaceae bacterium]
MREVCFLIGRGGAILYADASTSAAALPDSRARWEAIWQHRHELEAIVHSHPVGPAAFSAEDESTMAAIDSALGRPTRYCVVAPRITISRDTLDGEITKLHPEPWWVAVLRLASGMRTREEI